MAMDSPMASRTHSDTRKAVGAAFSSVSVLNASFRCSTPGVALGSSAESSGVDLLKVGDAEMGRWGEDGLKHPKNCS